MKRSITALTLALAVVLSLVISVAADVSRLELDNIAQSLVNSNRLRLEGDIVVDASRAGGVAAIVYGGNVRSRIAVDPRKMQSASANSWAFILGHELSHEIHRHNGSSGAAQEFQADVTGAALAINAGYDLRSYIIDMYSQPNSCSRTHGCFHSRARNLELKFRVNTGLWDGNHRNHASASGAFPR